MIFHFKNIFCMQDNYGHSGISVKTQIRVVYVDIAIQKFQKQVVQAAHFVCHFHTDNMRLFAQIAACFQYPDGLFRIGNNHADNAVFGTVIGDGTEYIDIFFL